VFLCFGGKNPLFGVGSIFSPTKSGATFPFFVFIIFVENNSYEEL